VFTDIQGGDIPIIMNILEVPNSDIRHGRPVSLSEIRSPIPLRNIQISRIISHEDEGEDGNSECSGKTSAATVICPGGGNGTDLRIGSTSDGEVDWLAVQLEFF
jgi:hypothetical protein